MTFPKAPAAALLSMLLLSPGCRSTEQSDTADAYKVRMGVTPAAGDRTQRVPLPAAVYVASQNPDLSDVRLFDATGKRLAVTLVDDREITKAEERTTVVPIYPIVGPVDGLKLTGISLRMDDGDRARIVGATGAFVSGAESNSVVGALLDTRAIAHLITAISLRADIPEQRPITLNLESSSDLKNWQPLAQEVLFRPAGSADVLGSGTIALQQPVDLDKRYVRVSWTGAPETSVRIKTAAVTTSTAPSARRIHVPTSAPTLVHAHDVRFSLSSGAKLDAINVMPTASDSIVPLRTFGRNTPEEPWRTLATGTVYGTGLRHGLHSNVIELGGSPYKMYKLEADSRTPGFSKPPQLELLYRPASLIALFTGSAPYTLAAGSGTAPNVFLTESQIVPAESDSLSRLPVATVAAPLTQTMTLVPVDTNNRISPRRALLWAILALGAAMLMLATFTLVRRAPSPQPLSH